MKMPFPFLIVIAIGLVVRLVGGLTKMQRWKYERRGSSWNAETVRRSLRQPFNFASNRDESNLDESNLDESSISVSELKSIINKAVEKAVEKSNAPLLQRIDELEHALDTQKSVRTLYIAPAHDDPPDYHVSNRKTVGRQRG